MSTTLTHPSLGAVQLPEDLAWTDEFTWARVEQKAEYSTTGALVLDAWAKQAGRPITLEGGDNYGWCDRATLNTLNTWAAQAGQTLTLTLRGVTRTVVFNHENGAISAEPVVPFSDPADADFYVVTVRFLEL